MAGGEDEVPGKRMILVIDDEPHLRTLLAYNLKLDGFEVTTAGDGPAGLAAARREPRPDVILLDWMMPGMDGLEVLTALKGEEATRGIPVVMLSAKGMLADGERATKMGADGYLTKPFDPAQVGRLLRESLGASDE